MIYRIEKVQAHDMLRPWYTLLLHLATAHAFSDDINADSYRFRRALEQRAILALLTP